MCGVIESPDVFGRGWDQSPDETLMLQLQGPSTGGTSQLGVQGHTVEFALAECQGGRATSQP